MIEANQSPGCKTQDGKLPHRDQKVAVRRLDVQLLEQLTWQRLAKFGAQRRGVITVVGHVRLPAAGSRLPASSSVIHHHAEVSRVVLQIIVVHAEEQPAARTDANRAVAGANVEEVVGIGADAADERGRVAAGYRASGVRR